MRFANGVSHGAELLLGADGIHSHDPPRALWRRSSLLYRADGVAGAYSRRERARRRARAVGPCPVARIGPSLLCLLSARPRRGEHRHPARYRAMGRGGLVDTGDVEEMRASFPNPEPRLAALLDAATECSKWGLFLRPLTDNWGRGRIQLIGDAAHAMLPNAGQGAAQAFEDAYILARWLAAMPADPAQPWRIFAASAFRACTRVQRSSSIIVRAKHDYDPAGRKSRGRKSTPSRRWRGSGAMTLSASWDLRSQRRSMIVCRRKISRRSHSCDAQAPAAGDAGR